jgi:hypothetical protein
VDTEFTNKVVVIDAEPKLALLVWVAVMIALPPPLSTIIFPLKIVAIDKSELVYVNAPSLLDVGGEIAKLGLPNICVGIEKLLNVGSVFVTWNTAVVVAAK